MAGLNKVMILGRLGRDPEVKSFNNGGRIVNLRVATSETWRDKNTGERKEDTEWHSVSISNEALGKIAEQYLRKGSEVMIEGKLKTRKWQDQSGNDRYTTEIVVGAFNGNLVLVGGRNDGQGGGRSGGDEDRGSRGGYDQPPEGQGRAGGSSGYGGGGRPGSGGRGDIDDEIPFAPEWR